MFIYIAAYTPTGAHRLCLQNLLLVYDVVQESNDLGWYVKRIISVCYDLNYNFAEIRKIFSFNFHPLNFFLVFSLITGLMHHSKSGPFLDLMT